MPSHPRPPRCLHAAPARRLLAVCLLGAALAGGALGVAQADELGHQGKLLDRIVAVVNDGVVLQSDLDALMTQISTRLRAQGVALPPEKVLRAQVLDQLVTEEIEAQRATHIGIKVSDEQVNDALQEIAKQQNVSFEDLPARMAQDGIDYDYYREQLRREIAREILQQQEVIQRIVVTPRELDQYIANQQNTVSGLYEYNASNILISIAQDASPDQLARASSLAHDIDERAKRGEDFAKLAVSYSQAETALQGGSLGWRKGSELPTFLADVIARLKPGAVSDVIQTSTGFHIVKLDARRAAGGEQIVQQVHLRHILMKPTELVDDATVQQKLSRIREQVLSGKEDFAVLARTSSQDPGSAVNGGDLGWTELRAFDPTFAAVAATLKVGEISEPFHTQFGWHIVQMLGRRNFDNTKDAERERAFEAVRNSRIDEATEQWLQQLKDGAYVKQQL
ncbi:MAG TPA: peptidylprolyl isomerase [Steroidobacteraceae bacterium]|jgi:peptidyl-prolyl cis-trans isomerase SurA|nr:peptidylprolyl isomerase [Steroidobacteraceae bacterium]